MNCFIESSPQELTADGNDVQMIDRVIPDVRISENTTLEVFLKTNKYPFSLPTPNGVKTGDVSIKGPLSISYANSGDFTIMQNLGNSTSECFSAFVYLYNLGNAAKYSTINFQGTGFTQDPDYISVFGAGKYLVAETINALQLKFSSDNVASGVFSLYGLAE